MPGITAPNPSDREKWTFCIDPSAESRGSTLDCLIDLLLDLDDAARAEAAEKKKQREITKTDTSRVT
jgi:hypothetical protein